MADTVDTLLRLETRLNRSFALCVALYLALGVMVVTFAGKNTPFAIGILALLLVLAWLASYVWFAVEVTLTAKALGKGAALFLVWMTVAPFLAILPIPLVSTLIAASPLSLKFLLAGQLRSEIHDRTFAEP